MFTVVGFRNVAFTDQRSGSQITGTTIYVTRKADGVNGVEGKKYFIKNSIDLKWLRVGATVNIFFNEYGKVDSITECKTAL